MVPNVFQRIITEFLTTYKIQKLFLNYIITTTFGYPNYKTQKHLFSNLFLILFCFIRPPDFAIAKSDIVIESGGDLLQNRSSLISNLV